MMNVVEYDFICQIETVVLVLIFYSIRSRAVQRARIKFYCTALIEVNTICYNIIFISYQHAGKSCF